MPDAAAPKGQGPLVLVLDDEARARELLADLLELEGYRVLTAADRGAAWDLYRGSTPDVVLADIQLAGGDVEGGLRFVGELQSQDPDLPVLVITAHPSLERAVTALRARVFDFLAKPVDDRRLLEALAAALRWRDLARERRGLAERMRRLETRRGERPERARAERQREDQLAVLGQLAAGIAHDLTAPLASCLLEVQAQRVGADDETLDHIESALRYMADLVEELGQFARSRAHERYATDDIQQGVAWAVRLVGKQYGGRLRIETHVPGDLHAPVDAVALRQILVALLSNAAQALGGAGRIELALERQGGALALEVRDRGPGVPEAIAPRLFEPQVTGRQEGHGLGLFMAARAARRQGWTLEHGARAGGGAVFRLTLPQGLR